MTNTVLFISDKNHLQAGIMGGVQLCTHEYINYITSAGYKIQEFHVEPEISLVTRVKIKIGIDAYDHYSVGKYLHDLTQVINSGGIKLVFLNQVSLAVFALKLKQHVAADVKFIGLSHGNESADYLHDITRQGIAGKLQAFKLGKLLINETKLFATALDGLIVLSEQEIAINQWLGANSCLFLPRLLSPAFVPWHPPVPNAGFVGTLSHLPNQLGIGLLSAELMQMNFSHKIQLIGGPPGLGERLAKKYDFINYKGQIKDEDLANEVQTWSVFLNPVFWHARGSSTKLAKAINWGIPCLTTPAGRRGYHLHNQSIVTPDNTPKSFAVALITALEQPGYIDVLKKATEENAVKFNKQPYVQQLTRFLSQLLKI